MGRKAGKYKRKENNGLVKKNSVRFDSDNEDMMDDEIDACMRIFLLKYMMRYKIYRLKIVLCCACLIMVRYCVFLFFIFVIVVHKSRDVVPLNIDEDMEESDEDNEQPVFDFGVCTTFYVLVPLLLAFE